MTDRDNRALVFRRRETRDFDYKGPMAWDGGAPECADIVADILGMANSGGGTLVVGVAEDDASPTGWRWDGVPQEHVRSWDQTKVGEVVREYAGAALEFTIERVALEQCIFVIVTVQPFRRHPFICLRSYEKPGVKGEARFALRRLAFYVRTEAAQTVEVQTPNQLMDLIEQAVQQRLEEVLVAINAGNGAAASALNREQAEFLNAITDAAFEKDNFLVSTRDLDAAILKGQNQGQLRERLEELQRRALLEIKRATGSLGFDVQLAHDGVIQGARNYGRAEEKVRREVCRRGRTTAEQIAEDIDLPRLLVKHIVIEYADRDLASISTTSNMTKVWRPRSELCEWDKIRHKKACVVIGPNFPNRGDHRQSFTVNLLNEGMHEARDIKFVTDVDGGFPDDPPDSLPFVIPGMTSQPSRRYRVSFFVPWPDRADRGEPIQGQVREVRLKVTFRDGLDDRDEAMFTLILRNDRNPNRWRAEELTHKATLSPICASSRMESA